MIRGNIIYCSATSELKNCITKCDFFEIDFFGNQFTQQKSECNM